MVADELQPPVLLAYMGGNTSSLGDCECKFFREFAGPALER